MGHVLTRFPLSGRELMILAAAGLILSPALKVIAYVGYSAWMGVWDRAVLRPLPALIGALLAVWLLLCGPSWSRIAVGLVGCFSGLANIAVGVGIAWVLTLVNRTIPGQSNWFAIATFVVFLLIAIPSLAAGILLLLHPELRRYLDSRTASRATAPGPVSA